MSYKLWAIKISSKEKDRYDVLVWVWYWIKFSIPFAKFNSIWRIPHIWLDWNDWINRRIFGIICWIFFQGFIYLSLSTTHSDKKPLNWMGNLAVNFVKQNILLKLIEFYPPWEFLYFKTVLLWSEFWVQSHLQKQISKDGKIQSISWFYFIFLFVCFKKVAAEFPRILLRMQPKVRQIWRSLSVCYHIFHNK